MNKLLSPAPFGQSAMISIIRIITGLMMVYHGLEMFNEEIMNRYLGWDVFKKYSDPSLVVKLGKTAELVSGVCLVLGLFTRPASLLLMGTMSYITFFVGRGKVWYEDQHPFLIVMLAILFFFTGPGRWGLDNMLFRKK